jgi:hypothetical protein
LLLRRWVRGAACVCLCLLAALCSTWSAAALFYDFPIHGFGAAAAVGFVVCLGALLWISNGLTQRLLCASACFLLVLIWWLGIAPSNVGQWQPDVSQMAYAEVAGSRITFHNVRNCDYRAEFNYTCQWLTREIDLNNVTGVDLFMDYWGSPWIAHTIVSFELGKTADGKMVDPIAFSIEVRKQKGQSYSAVRGFFRQYTLISIVSGERDVVRLRTNYRHGEDLYLYHTKATPEFARSLMLDYVALTNDLQQKPEWYNAVTHNCTTEIFTFKAMQGRPKDWRILLNGKADEMLYNQDELATTTWSATGNVQRLPFAELKEQAHINAAAKAADKDPAFSARIRQGRPGFEDVK